MKKGVLFLVVPLVICCLVLLYGTNAIVEPMIEANNTVRVMEASNSEPINSADRASQNMEDVAKAGFAANAAIAASADASQTSMVKYFVSVFWAFAIAIVAICVTYIVAKAKKNAN